MKFSGKRMELDKNYPEWAKPNTERQSICTPLQVDIGCQIIAIHAIVQKLRESKKEGGLNEKFMNLPEMGNTLDFIIGLGLSVDGSRSD